MERLTPIGGHQYMYLKLIEQVEKSPRLTRRQAAKVMGVSVRLGHGIVTRLLEKGYLEVTKYHSRRWDYFLTPKGIAEKSRLTMEFLDFSMRFYREARRRSAQLCRELSEAGTKRVAFLGVGDLSEIAYLGVQEWGLALVAVYGDQDAGTFMRLPVRPLAEFSPEVADVTIVCLYDRSQPMSDRYLPAGMKVHPAMRWVFDKSDSPPGPSGPPIL